jgi:thiosulfate dehydrogenase
MKFLRKALLPICIGIIICIVLFGSILTRSPKQNFLSSIKPYDENSGWSPPDFTEVPPDSVGDLIRYGKELISNTSFYLGSQGIISSITNGMNCQNCHIDAGTRNFANPFSAVAATYPKYRDRSGRIESIEFRVNECLQRSLNGKPIDSLSYEMRAFVAYLKWVGQGVPKDVKPKGSSTLTLAYLNTAADTAKGKIVYVNECQRCHGINGEGVLTADKKNYSYPPVWGDHSFNVSAGMYRLSGLAGFIKSSMPFDKAKEAPFLTDEEAWDVAAYISSQQRTVKIFAEDWPDISKKPVDYPFGPYADSFSQIQHKYGPFLSMKKIKKAETNLPAH